MTFLTKGKWNQIIEEFKQSVRVRDDKERQARDKFLSEIDKEINGVVFEFLDSQELVYCLKTVCQRRQRNKMREIAWMKKIVLITEEKTGTDVWSKMGFPPEGIDIDDPVSRQRYLHEQKVNHLLGTDRSKVIEELAEDLWVSTRTIDADLEAIRNFPDESTILRIKLDMTITECGHVIRSLYEQSENQLYRVYSEALISRIWYQMRMDTQKKLYRYFEILGSKGIKNYLNALNKEKKPCKSELELFRLGCVPVEGKTDYLRFPKEKIIDFYHHFMKISLKGSEVHIQLKSGAILAGHVTRIDPVSFSLTTMAGDKQEIEIKDVIDFQLNFKNKKRN